MKHKKEMGLYVPAYSVLERYREVRSATERLVAPFSPEDCVAQSMPEASPLKWHLAHTTWFFERFVLKPRENYRVYDPSYDFLFNSYYESVGQRHPRPERGLLTRPSLDEIKAYRAYVDQRVEDLLNTPPHDPEVLSAFEVGVEHEMQHQELIVTDITNLLSHNPLRPAVIPAADVISPEAPKKFSFFDSQLISIGNDGPGFAFDNEKPRHRVFVERFSVSNRLVTNGEYMEFIADRGYERPELWLSDGWTTMRVHQWQAPLYWERKETNWHRYGLDGFRLVDVNAPVQYVSYFEADAFAHWAHSRLPTEAEWELAASSWALEDAFGAAWQWTSSAYSPYPGFRTFAGSLGEYNGKFMSGQMVLRGASSATPFPQHRITYRNFFPPHTRWQIAGIRLARSP